MEIKSQTNTFEGGMDMDTDVSFMSNNTYRYAENVRLVTDTNGTNGILQNIQYIKEYLELEQLKDQTILYAIAAQIPDDEGELQNSAIVLTQDNKERSHNHLYIVSNFNRQNISCKCILKILWRITKEDDITMVYNYETSSVYKLYINTFSKGLNILNLADLREEWGDKPVEDNPSKYSTQTTSLLPPLEFQKFSDGSLLSGTYQYYYKLYTDTGIITTLSPGSELIYNAKTTSNYTESGGYTENYYTSNGIQISVTLNNNQFDRYQAFRVRWNNNNDLPSIELFSEGKISQGSNVTLTLIDSSNNVISTVTQEEFNDIIPFLFNAKTMYQFGNRLFFSNITSDSWDIPDSYDCRAYRCNKSGKVKLMDATNNEQYNESLSSIIDGTIVIDKEADAINPMNAELLYPDKDSDDEYAYNSSGRYGGEGINITYDIVYAETQEGAQNSGLEYGKSIGSIEQVGPDGLEGDIVSENIDLFYLGTSQSIDEKINLNSSQLISFCNPIIATKLASYQRDEVYRFGIVFYNSSSVSSPVHWIGDVRFPAGYVSGCKAFDADADKGIELIARPLGIRFTIKNFPEGAQSAEIVRCDRTSLDRSIRAQGMLNSVVSFQNISYGGQFDPNVSLGSNDVRVPFVPMNDSLSYGQVLANYDSANTKWSSSNNGKVTVVSDIKTFASPEICVNPDAENIQSGDVVVPIYIARSMMDYRRTVEAEGDTIGNIYAISRVLAREGGGSYYDFPLVRIYSGRKVLIRDNDDQVDGVSLMKYYNLTSADQYYTNYGPDDSETKKQKEEVGFTHTIKQYKTARRDLPFQGFTDYTNALQSYKGTYVDVINGKSFTNIAYGDYTFGVAGINGLIGFDNLEATNILEGCYTANSSLPDEYRYSVLTIICNIKRRLNPYGGNTYYNRAANVYISCGSYIKSGERTCIAYGGDTFLTKFCYQQVGMIAANEWRNVQPESTQALFVNIPVESTINTYMRSDEIPDKGFDVANFNPAYYHTSVGTINGISQTTAMYQYNSAYSVSSGGVNYAAVSTNRNISNTENNRYQIVCTEAKSAGEVLDSWAVSKFANTLDMDSKYGQVSKLIDFRDRLYVLQQNALSVLSINERSLISDNSGSALVLGQGGILDRYDVIVQNYGTNVINDRSAIATFQSIYWYDNNKNVICSYGNDGFHILSKEKKVQTFLNNIAQVNQVDAISTVNDKQNEVWMKFKGKLLVYNEQSNQFTSFYTHNPDWGLRFFDRLVTIQNKRFYYTNTFGEEDVVKELTSKLTFVVNQDQQYTKVFDNQWFSGNIEDPNNDKPQVLSNINFNTKTQDSFNINYNNVECREDTYRFPIPRQDRGDIGTGDEENQNVINRSYQPRMRGKYLLCNYEFNCDNDRQFEIPFIKTTYRYSML